VPLAFFDQSKPLSILLFASQIICALGYLSISYWMTGQPMEWSRLLPFFVLCVLTSLTAQAFGFFIGATLPVTVSFFLTSV
jgi:ABC-2 type transporter